MRRRNLLAGAGSVAALPLLSTLSTSARAQSSGVSDNAIEVCLSRLRAKIEPGGVQLRTVRGLGVRPVWMQGYMKGNPHGPQVPGHYRGRPPWVCARIKRLRALHHWGA